MFFPNYEDDPLSVVCNCLFTSPTHWNVFNSTFAPLNVTLPRNFTFGSIHVQVRGWRVRSGRDVTSGLTNMGLQALQQASPLKFSSRRQRLAYEGFSKKPPHVCQTEITNYFFAGDALSMQGLQNHNLKFHTGSSPLILMTSCKGKLSHYRPGQALGVPGG